MEVDEHLLVIDVRGLIPTTRLDPVHRLNKLTSALHTLEMYCSSLTPGKRNNSNKSGRKYTFEQMHYIFNNVNTFNVLNQKRWC